MSEFKLLRGPVLLLGCLIGAGAGTAQAQTESSAAPARGLEEITVTARRREESLQQVPLAITAFSAEQLEASRIDGLQDIAQRTPGLIYQDINGGLSLPVIRGLAQTNILTSDNNVGFFLNGVYLANSRALDLGLIDLERVEIVKGPQSALYGQNSFAGAINYVTKRAPDEFRATARATLGSDDIREFSGSIGGAISDTFRANAAIYWKEFDGTFKNELDPGNNLQGSQSKGAAVDLEFKPTEAFSARLWGYFTDTESEQVAQYLVPNNCGRSAFGTPTYYCGALPTNGLFYISPGATGRNASNQIIALEFDYAINDAWSIKTQSAKFDSDSDFYLDFDYSQNGVPFGVTNLPLPAFPAQPMATRTVLTQTYLGQGLSEWDEQSHEVRLGYESGPITSYVGLYYYDSDRQSGSNGAVDSSALVAGEVFTSGVARIFATTNPVGAPIPSNASVDTVTTKGVFGKLEWRVSDRWRITGEVRRAEDEKSINRLRNFAAPVSPTSPIFFQSATFEYTTPRLTVDWQPTQDLLVYALYAEGARAGGFNTVVTRPDEATFGPEESKNYEFGIKTTLFDRRIRANLATYYVDWSDLQIASRSQDPNNIFNVTRNTGNAIASGFELETAARVNDYVQIGLNYAFMNPRFAAGSTDLGLSGGDAGTVVGGVFVPNATAFTSGPCGVDSSICRRLPATGGRVVGPADVGGSQLGRTINDQWSAFVDVEAPLTDQWRWFLNADWSLQGQQPLAANLTAYLDKYSVVNARVGAKNDRYEVALWARNLADEDYLTAASNQPRFHTGSTFDVTFGQGRTVGITGKVNFGTR